MENFLIRKAVPDDAYGIASVNASTRYTTYKWLMPQKVLETRLGTIPEKAEKVKNSIQKNNRFLVAVNLENNEVIWMLSYGPSRDEKYPNNWEIYAFYILKEYQKLGIGKKLFLAWIEELIKLWYKDMIINVLKWNNAINFYKKYGGKVVWERSDEIWKTTIYEDILYFENMESIQ